MGSISMASHLLSHFYFSISLPQQIHQPDKQVTKKWWKIFPFAKCNPAAWLLGVMLAPLPLYPSRAALEFLGTFCTRLLSTGTLSQCQPLCTHCRLHLEENRGLKSWHSLLLAASPRRSSLSSNARACCLPRLSRIHQGRTGSNPCTVRMGHTYPSPFCAKPQWE